MKRHFFSIGAVVCVLAVVGVVAMNHHSARPNWLATTTVKAQDYNLTVPFKAQVPDDLATNGDRLDVILRLYDRPDGGTSLFEERRNVTVNGSIFVAFVGQATKGGVPPDVLPNGHTWAEWALANDPANPIGDRLEVFVRRGFKPNGVGTAASLCFTCGGAYPFFAGGQQVAPNLHPTELDSGCGGVYADRADTFPFLCVGY